MQTHLQPPHPLRPRLQASEPVVYCRSSFTSVSIWTSTAHRTWLKREQQADKIEAFPHFATAHLTESRNRPCRLKR
jgi:hypothetical protein